MGIESQLRGVVGKPRYCLHHGHPLRVDRRIHMCLADLKSGVLCAVVIIPVKTGDSLTHVLLMEFIEEQLKMKRQKKRSHRFFQMITSEKISHSVQQKRSYCPTHSILCSRYINHIFRDQVTTVRYRNCRLLFNYHYIKQAVDVQKRYDN